MGFLIELAVASFGLMMINAIARVKMKVGMAHMNDQPVNDLANNPFGGQKNSGLGWFGGDWIIEEFTLPQRVTVSIRHANIRSNVRG